MLAIPHGALSFVETSNGGTSGRVNCINCVKVGKLLCGEYQRTHTSKCLVQMALLLSLQKTVWLWLPLATDLGIMVL